MSYPTFWGVPKQLIDKYGQTKWTSHLADGTGFGGNLYKLTKWDQGRPPRVHRQRQLLGQAGDHSACQLHAVQRRQHRSGPTTSLVLATPRTSPSAELATAKALKGSTYQQVTALSISYLHVS